MKKSGICKIILCILAVLLSAESVLLILLRDVIGLAKNLGMKTIAEGVETEAQTDFLLSLGCDGIQGYYYSKPLPKSDFTEYLKR